MFVGRMVEGSWVGGVSTQVGVMPEMMVLRRMKYRRRRWNVDRPTKNIVKCFHGFVLFAGSDDFVRCRR